MTDIQIELRVRTAEGHTLNIGQPTSHSYYGTDLILSWRWDNDTGDTLTVVGIDMVGLFAESFDATWLAASQLPAVVPPGGFLGVEVPVIA